MNRILESRNMTKQRKVINKQKDKAYITFHKPKQCLFRKLSNGMDKFRIFDKPRLRIPTDGSHFSGFAWV